MSADSSGDDLLDLLAAYGDESISEEALRQLEQRLRVDAAARRRLLDYVDLSLDLRQQCMTLPATGAEAEAAASAPVAAHGAARSTARENASPSPWVQRPVRFWSLVTIATLLIWIGVLSWTAQRRKSLPLATAPAQAATLLETVDVKWEHGSIQWTDGTQLAAGRELRLAAGFAHVRFDDGATVILEGPCRFTIASRAAGQLQRGQLTAKVPAEAVGFTVTTRATRVVDLGTEFGLRVDADDTALIAVFAGAVKLLRIDAAGRVESGAGRRVDAGNALQMALGAADWQPVVSPSPAQFTRNLPAPTAGTVGYWRFEEGGFLADSSGNQHTLRALGTVRPHEWSEREIEPPLRLAPPTEPSNARSADLGQRAGYFEAAFQPALASGDFTVEAIVQHRPAASLEGYFIASRWETVAPANQRSWALGVAGEGPIVGGGPTFRSGELIAGLSPDGTMASSVYLGSGFVLEPGQCYYVAVAYLRPRQNQSGQITFWLQPLKAGESLRAKTLDTSVSIFRAPHGPLRIGRLNLHKQQWSGLLDEVRYSNGALGSDQLLISRLVDKRQPP